MTRKIVISLLIAMVMFAATIAIWYYGLFEKPEHIAYDIQAKLLRADEHVNKNLKVILVDEASLKAMADIAGRWPWPRAIWADLLDFLSMGGAKAVLFDIVYLERQDELNDRALIDATAAAQNVYHSMMITREEREQESVGSAGLYRSMPKEFVERFALRNVSGKMTVREGAEYNDFALPITGLAEASRGMTVVEFSPDIDGVFRRTRPIREYRGRYFPVLGIASLVDVGTPITVDTASLQIGGRTIPLDDNGNCIINMYGLEKIETYSMSGIFASLQKIRQGEVENLLVNPETFRDSVVFIGASAVGTADLKAIPIAPSAPGVMLHVFLANNYQNNDFMRPPDKRLTFASIVIGIFITTWAVMFNKRLIFRATFPMMLTGLYIGFALFSFKSNMLVDVVPFIYATMSTGFLSFGYLTFTEAAEKRRVSHLFTQYVSKDVLDEVLHNYKEYLKTSSGQKVEITILFSDIRGFTTISETTPPDKIVEMLNIHFSVMADIILKHNGTIDKYIGDAIMAFWGAPVKTVDHAEQAVRAGIEMLDGLKQVNETLRERGFEHEVKIGIGINTGVATIGNIGSEQKKNYTVVGDTVNLASRLESITKEYKTPLIYSEYTYAKIKDKIRSRILGNVKVKGREQPVDIYTTE